MANFWRKSVPLALYQAKRPFSSMQREWDKALSEFKDWMEHAQLSSERFENRSIMPVIDIVEDENNFKLEAEMPGMGEDDIKLSINEGMLTIQGEKHTSKKDQGKNYLSREIEYGYYERSIPLPDSIDTDKASASFKKGMLWVNFPKKPEAANQLAKELKIEKA